jgi:glycosyltransferase involved in cell wall biosynthesis
VVINGRFLSQATTGVQRFARELVTALDELISSAPSGVDYSVVAPPNAVIPEGPWRSIPVRKFGRLSGHAWEQFELPAAARDAFVVNLCNSGPVLLRRQLTFIHDAAIYRRPDNYSMKYRVAHAALDHLLVARSDLGTVSHFSAKELASVLGVSVERILVVPNGGDHILRVAPDREILNRFAVGPGDYFVCLGSLAKTKNLVSAVAAFDGLAEQAKLLLVGSLDGKIFNAAIGGLPPGIICTGRLSDAEIAGLLVNARALIFPSLYEGFGIPPLEAMSLACPVVAADIAPVREVCGDAVLYAPPTEVEALRAQMVRVADPAVRRELSARGAERARAFTWRASAEGLHRHLCGILGV